MGAAGAAAAADAVAAAGRAGSCKVGGVDASGLHPFSAPRKFATLEVLTSNSSEDTSRAAGHRRFDRRAQAEAACRIAAMTPRRHLDTLYRASGIPTDEKIHIEALQHLQASRLSIHCSAIEACLWHMMTSLETPNVNMT